MLCDDCKSRPASIFFKEVNPGKIVELHLCEQCAHKRGLLMAKKLSPIEILQKMLKEKSAKDEKIICKNCCLSLAEFKRIGRFGCSKCLSEFGPQINHLIKQIHQNDRHIGRSPVQCNKNGFEVFKLRAELKKALEKEEYEDAARIRDQLKKYGIEDNR